MDPETYDGWHRTRRGSWIGRREVVLIGKFLDPSRSHTILDVGSGTGYFTRALGGLVSPAVTALDPKLDWLRWSASHQGKRAPHVAGDAIALPFRDGAFDHTISVTALCFIGDQRRAVEEIVRVTRRRFAIGVLNRRSLLYRRSRNREGYRGAHWHTVAELRSLFRGLQVRELSFRTAVQIPSGGPVAEAVEHLIPSAFRLGGFLLVSGEAAGGTHGEFERR